tara:strand:- start:2556 stop:2936 length:381 start_codon:yes stop_codon:yes gene_type:complete
MTVLAVVKQFGIAIGVVIIGVILLYSFNFFMENISGKKIINEYTNIEKYRKTIKEYENIIIELKSSTLQQDSLINSLLNTNDSLAYTIVNLEKIKIIKKDGTAVKLQVIDNLSINELDSFFTSRFN